MKFTLESEDDGDQDKKKKTIGQKVSLWLQKNQPNK